ncbi:MAG TPA: enoyl-CoA hydratase-related protein, partial [Burkholderiales bacterium]|nr:enoyl-CoA hydratase-related protein [Burkholderiales bacterium]
MTAKSVLVSVDADGIAVVTLNRPEVHNAFDDRLIAALTAELRKLDADARVRAVVIAGNGKSLSAGADLNWLKRAAKYSDADNLKDA